MKKIMIKILALLIIFIVSFVALEALFRLYRGKDLALKVTTGKELNSGYDFEPDKSFKNKSSKKDEFNVYVKINNFGFRGKDMKLEKTPGVGYRSPISYYLKLRNRYLDFSDLRDDWHAERGAVHGKDEEIARIDPFMVYGKRDWWGMIVRNSEVFIYARQRKTSAYTKTLGKD